MNPHYFILSLILEICVVNSSKYRLTLAATSLDFTSSFFELDNASSIINNEPLIDFKFLLNCIVKQKINVTFIGSFYSKDDFEIELEAYCFEKFISYTDIDLLLNAFCL